MCTQLTIRTNNPYRLQIYNRPTAETILIGPREERRLERREKRLQQGIK